MSDFYDLAQVAEANPQTADFAALRQAYVQSDAYRPFKHIPQSKLMQITNSVDGFGEVVDTCKNILLSNPLDLEARMLLAIAYEKAGDTQESEKHHQFAEKMIDAIIATGDGKSFEQAFVIIAENEAWTLMRSFGIKAKTQERHQKDGKIYDVFLGKRGEDEVKVYFDVTLLIQNFDETLISSDSD